MIHGVVLIFLGQVFLDEFFKMLECRCEIFILGEIFYFMLMENTPTQFALPTAVRNNASFIAHFISQFLHVPEHFLVSVEFDLLTTFHVKQTENKSG